MSIDCYIAGPNGEMDWMVWDWAPGQSASFEFLVGGDQPADGINDLSQIGKVKYHVGL